MLYGGNGNDARFGGRVAVNGRDYARDYIYGNGGYDTVYQVNVWNYFWFRWDQQDTIGTSER